MRFFLSRSTYSAFCPQIIACHIDYGNRVESAAEAAFVEAWCAKYNIVFRKRRIEEVCFRCGGQDVVL